MDRKPRADARLKNLPAARQESIADYARTHSLDDTVAWLRADGVATSSGALSEFLSCWRLKVQLDRNASAAERLITTLRAASPQLDPVALQTAGQAFFTALAIEQQDPKVWSATQQIELRREALKLERDKFQAAREAAREAVEESAAAKSGKLDAETKAEILAAIDRKLVGL